MNSHIWSSCSKQTVLLLNKMLNVLNTKVLPFSGKSSIHFFSKKIYIISVISQGSFRNRKSKFKDFSRCKITALKGFLYTDGPFRAVSRTVQIFNNMGRQKSRQNFTFL